MEGKRLKGPSLPPPSLQGPIPKGKWGRRKERRKGEFCGEWARFPEADAAYFSHKNAVSNFTEGGGGGARIKVLKERETNLQRRSNITLPFPLCLLFPNSDPFPLRSAAASNILSRSLPCGLARAEKKTIMRMDRPPNLGPRPFSRNRRESVALTEPARAHGPGRPGRNFNQYLSLHFPLSRHVSNLLYYLKH